ncbi:hypothetical protein DPEC_G00279450 [Dallia pectoralis]|uniref:Uncharacterized protein n=1 Tax=Dallia pectoralis TaxID=75939 RepID=A0ACC2FM34_DALPE|nr:hypothetical protein DPEC_G00279450 [Dallia pectoralis]
MDAFIYLRGYIQLNIPSNCKTRFLLAQRLVRRSNIRPICESNPRVLLLKFDALLSPIAHRIPYLQDSVSPLFAPYGTVTDHWAPAPVQCGLLSLLPAAHVRQGSPVIAPCPAGAIIKSPD